MGKERVAIVGIGQTQHTAIRGDVSIAGLVREAAQRALDDAQMTLGRHRRRRHRQGPRLLRGRDDARAATSPTRSARSASPCSGCTPPARSAGRPRSSPQDLVAAGVHERVLTVAFEKQSESRGHVGALAADPVPAAAASPAPAATSPRTSAAYMRRSKAPDHIGILVALKDRLNALKNPYAHLHEHRHHLRLGQGLDDALGPDPLLRDLPVAPTAPAPWCSPTRRAATPPPPTVARRRGSTARRCAPSRRCSPAATR